MEKGIILIWLAEICSGIVLRFLHNELVCNSPAPFSKTYDAVNPADKIPIPDNSHVKNNQQNIFDLTSGSLINGSYMMCCICKVTRKIGFSMYLTDEPIRRISR